jgi:hypothetical protein
VIKKTVIVFSNNTNDTNISPRYKIQHFANIYTTIFFIMFIICIICII